MTPNGAAPDRAKVLSALTGTDGSTKSGVGVEIDLDPNQARPGDTSSKMDAGAMDDEAEESGECSGPLIALLFNL